VDVRHGYFEMNIIKLKLRQFWLRLSHPKNCNEYECDLCGERDCPGGAWEHYWHDGCPYCWVNDINGYRTGIK
jgi:hypothetical protein